MSRRFRFIDEIIINEIVNVFDLSLFKNLIFNIIVSETIYLLIIIDINNKGLLLDIKKVK